MLYPASRFAGTAALVVLLLGPPPLAVSDHADPQLDPLPSQGGGITGLFVFPKQGRMVVILNVHRGLASPPPYDLAPWEYTVYMDLRSRVRFDDPEALARYGGTVVNPEGIEPTLAVRFRLNDDASLREGYPQYEGVLAGAGRFPAYSGVRDDPFIFPPFFGKNVISMAVSIPFSAFPQGQQDWLVWGTVTEVESDEKVDHVGRANRTQLGRLDFLNVLPPKEHVRAVRERRASGQRFVRFLTKVMSRLPEAGALESAFGILVQIRPYDDVPDVMIFTVRRPPGFPNGRRLEDDVVGLTCAHGECALQETAFRQGGWPRRVTNDRPFLDGFPYVAEPWPPTEPAGAGHAPGGRIRIWLLAGGALLLAALLSWAWSRRRRRRSNRGPAPDGDSGA